MTKQWRINTKRKLIRQRKACAVITSKVLAKAQSGKENPLQQANA